MNKLDQIKSDLSNNGYIYKQDVEWLLDIIVHCNEAIEERDKRIQQLCDELEIHETVPNNVKCSIHYLLTKLGVPATKDINYLRTYEAQTVQPRNSELKYNIDTVIHYVNSHKTAKETMCKYINLIGHTLM